MCCTNKTTNCIVVMHLLWGKMCFVDLHLKIMFSKYQNTNKNWLVCKLFHQCIYVYIFWLFSFCFILIIFSLETLFVCCLIYTKQEKNELCYFELLKTIKIDRKQETEVRFKCSSINRQVWVFKMQSHSWPEDGDTTSRLYLQANLHNSESNLLRIIIASIVIVIVQQNSFF